MNRLWWDSLRASSLGHSGYGAGKGRRACNCVSGIFNSTSNSPVAPCWLSCQISANQREAETSSNVNKHWKTCAKGNDVITNVISANQHFASTFSMQIVKFQRRSLLALLPFPAPPQEGPRDLARRLVMRGQVGGRRLPLTGSMPALGICALTYEKLPS